MNRLLLAVLGLLAAGLALALPALSGVSAFLAGAACPLGLVLLDSGAGQRE